MSGAGAELPRGGLGGNEGMRAAQEGPEQAGRGGSGTGCQSRDSPAECPGLPGVTRVRGRAGGSDSIGCQA